MPKVLDLLKKYQANQQQFEDFISTSNSPVAKSAKLAFETAFNSASMNLSQKDSSFEKSSLKELLKHYDDLASRAELSPALRGELKAKLAPKISEFYSTSYEKISSELFSGLKGGLKQQFSQTKILNEMGVLDHGGRCLPLAKLYLAALAKGRSAELFAKLGASTDASAVSSVLHEMHASGANTHLVASNVPLARLPELLEKDGALLLNTPTHSMAAAKIGDKFYFFDPNAVVAEFSSASAFSKALKSYFGTKYGDLIGFDGGFNEIVSVDVSNLSPNLARINGLKISLDDFLAVDIMHSATKSAEYANVAQNLPEHAFANTNNNANLSTQDEQASHGRAVFGRNDSDIKAALADAPDGGYWLGRDVLLSDADIGYDLSRFSEFVASHKEYDGGDFVYALKNGDNVDILRFSDDDGLSGKEYLSNFGSKLLEYKVGETASSLLAMTSTIASLANAQNASPQDKANIASGSLVAIGEALDSAASISVAAGAPNALSAVLGGANGVLNGVSSVISMGVLASKFKTLAPNMQIAAGFELGLKAAGGLASAGSSISAAISAIKGTSASLPAMGAAAAALSLAISPVQIASLLDDGKRVSSIARLGEKMRQAGYEGDSLLAGILKDKLAFEGAQAGIGMGVAVATAALQAGAAASVVGAPVAVVAGVIGGVVLGIIEAAKQPALEAIAQSYRAQIEELGGMQTLGQKGLQALAMQALQEYALAQKEHATGYDSVINLGGFSASASMLELAAITKNSENLKLAQNFALFDDEIKAVLNEDGRLVLDTKADDKVLISFSTPLFAPGLEEKERLKVGKNNYYTSLALKLKDGYEIIGGAGDETYMLADKYASVVMLDDDKSEHIAVGINAGDGDDVLIGDGGFVKFDGASGNDSAVYGALSGISVVAGNKSGEYEVFKFINDAELISEKKGVYSTSYGKRSESLEYRELEITKASYSAKDELSGVERIIGSDFDDSFEGGEFDDFFVAGAGDDVLIGKAGNDVLSIGAGRDYVDAGDGDDVVIVGADDFGDTLIGGAGRDTLVLDVEARVDLGAGLVFRFEANDSISGFENVLSGAGDDVLIGDSNDNILNAGLGTNKLYGGDGDDVLVASVGSNLLYGDSGADTYVLGESAFNEVQADSLDSVLLPAGQSFSIVKQGDELVISFDAGGRASVSGGAKIYSGGVLLESGLNGRYEYDLDELKFIV